MIMGSPVEILNLHGKIPWKRSLYFRLIILLALVSVICCMMMFLFLSRTPLRSPVIVLHLLVSILLNLVIIKKYVISPINKISSGVRACLPDAKTINRNPMQPVMRYGDELAALEQGIIEMEARVFSSMEAERKASSVKNMFLANMSHELKTPLNSTIHLIKEALSLQEPKARKAVLEQAYASSNDLLSVLNTILEISNIESGNLVLAYTPFVLNEALLEIQNVIQTLCMAKGIAWEPRFKIPKNLTVRGDKIRLMQALAILLRNAVKYASEEYGRVTFIVEPINETSDRASFRFEIRDNGIGMTAKKLGELTQIFSTEESDLRFGLTEIMLSVCSNIVKAMGGHITVESSQGEGLRPSGASLSFPIEFEKAPLPAPLSMDSFTHRDYTGRCALVVDDVGTNRTVLRHILSQKGMDIIEARDGFEALSIFKEDHQKIDIILMDIMMPNMDGHEATTEIRSSGLEKGQVVPIIAVTTRSYKEDVDASAHAGMNYHLEKPVDPDKLLSVIGDLLP